MSTKVIGSRLTKLRKARKLTQDEVSKNTGINRSTYSNYESGNREPDIDTIKMLAKYFDVSVNYILGETNDPTPIAAAISDSKSEVNAAIIREIVSKFNFDLTDPKSRGALESFLKTLDDFRHADGK